MNFSITRELDRSYEQTLEALPGALKAEGFGVLTEIDIQATLKEKLGIDFRRYKILGACNPPLAHKALSADLLIGLMLPCNVVVFETERQTTMVAAIDPTSTMAHTDNPVLADMAAQVRDKLAKVLEGLA